MLDISSLYMNYDVFSVLQNINFSVKDKQWVSIIGGNGAGKTSLIRTIMGLYPSLSGKIKFKDRDITNQSTSEICKLGLAHVPEGRQIFPHLTVQENFEVATYALKVELKNNLERIYELFPRLKERYKQKAGTLSGGEQQMLAIGRALITNPKMILCDEPSLGLSPIMVKELFSILKNLHQQGISILLVEQNVKESLSFADYAYVLEQGSIIKEGIGKNLVNDPIVQSSYLGI